MAALAPPGRSSRPLLGVLFMCAACALFPIMNGFVKLLAATYDPLQIVWFRIVIHLVLVAMVFMPRMGLGLFRTRRIGSQFVNSVMMLLSTLFFFSAVKYVGVAEAISISFVAPPEVKKTATCEPGAMNPLTPAGPGSATLNAIVPVVGIVSALEAPCLPNFVNRICSPG